MNLAFVKSKKFLVFSLLFIIGLSYLNFVQYKKSDNSDLFLAKQQLEQEREKNKNLASLKSYLETDVYLERQAREKFKMAKPGENLILIQEIPGLTAKKPEEKNLPNFLKWLEYLIK